MKVGIVVPHIFMHEDILPHVIFSPGQLAMQLAEELQDSGTEVVLFTPGPINNHVQNITADLTYFQAELNRRGTTYLEILKKHPFTFVTLARQVQSELITLAFDMANKEELDIVHIYTNEEDIALPFSKLCNKPVIFTHHDPFNFLVKYKSVFPKYKELNWLSLSMSQRDSMPTDTNWVGNIYHGLAEQLYSPVTQPQNNYIAYLGRIIEPKGLHLAIAATKAYNQANPSSPFVLKIAGKHYSENKKDNYWQKRILPALNDEHIEYVGFIDNTTDKESFLGNASALVIPSTYEEPFGMVMIEALACGTPIIGLQSGAIPEIVKHNKTGILVDKSKDEANIIAGLKDAFGQVYSLSRQECRADFIERFTLRRMCQEHVDVYKKLL